MRKPRQQFFHLPLLLQLILWKQAFDSQQNYYNQNTWRLSYMKKILAGVMALHTTSFHAESGVNLWAVSHTTQHNPTHPLCALFIVICNISCSFFTLLYFFLCILTWCTELFFLISLYRYWPGYTHTSGCWKPSRLEFLEGKSQTSPSRRRSDNPCL